MSSQRVGKVSGILSGIEKFVYLQNMEYPRLIELPRFLDPRGNLTVIEQCEDVPFAIARCHWIYDVPGGGARDGHAYRENEELIIALSGSFSVTVRTEKGEETYRLNRSYIGLYVPKGTWREFDDFATNSVALVLSSAPYREEDYITDPGEYSAYRKDLVKANGETYDT